MPVHFLVDFHVTCRLNRSKNLHSLLCRRRASLVEMGYMVFPHVLCPEGRHHDRYIEHYFSVFQIAFCEVMQMNLNHEKNAVHTVLMCRLSPSMNFMLQGGHRPIKIALERPFTWAEQFWELVIWTAMDSSSWSALQLWSAMCYSTMLWSALPWRSSHVSLSSFPTSMHYSYHCAKQSSCAILCLEYLSTGYNLAWAQLEYASESLIMRGLP